MDKDLFKHFPEGKDPRENQVKLLLQLQDAFKSDKKFVVVNAPTGVGKSFLAATIANSSDNPSIDFKQFVNSYRIWNPVDGKDEAYKFPHYGAAVLTVTKNLQDQYTKDFDNLHLLKGKTNYLCEYDGESDVESAPCTSQNSLKRQCWDCDRCTYYTDRNNSISNQFGVFNYDVWLHLPDHARRKEILICDEASEIENVIISFFSLDISYEWVEKLLEVQKYPRIPSEEPNKAYDWLMELKELIDATVDDNAELLEEPKHKNNKGLKFRQKGLERLQNDFSKVIGNFAKNGENQDAVEYVIERVAPDRFNKNVKEGVTFTPYRANKLAKKLFNSVEKVMFLSATIIDHKKEMSDLGIERDEYTYIEAPSAFDPMKSPIYVVGNFPLTYNLMEKNLPKVTEITSRILDKHSKHKGLIHTVSFKITKAVEEGIINDRLIFRDDGKTNDILLKEHSESDEPTVMVSPSMSHGVDLKGDLGRFQVIMKVPYLPLSNKRIKRLSKEDYKWYLNKTLSSLVQMAGRCTRTDTDKAVTYIVDGAAANLLKRNWNKLPKYFRDRIKV